MMLLTLCIRRVERVESVSLPVAASSGSLARQQAISTTVVGWTAKTPKTSRAMRRDEIRSEPKKPTCFDSWLRTLKPQLVVVISSSCDASGSFRIRGSRFEGFEGRSGGDRPLKEEEEEPKARPPVRRGVVPEGVPPEHQRRVDDPIPQQSMGLKYYSILRLIGYRLHIRDNFIKDRLTWFY